MRKFFLGAALLAALAVPVVAAANTLQGSQQNGYASCPEGSVGTYHFVHTTPSSSSGTITATFSSGVVQAANGAPFQAAVLHYYVEAEGSLITANDDPVSGGRLVLSDWSCSPVKKGGEK